MLLLLVRSSWRMPKPVSRQAAKEASALSSGSIGALTPMPYADTVPTPWSPICVTSDYVPGRRVAAVNETSARTSSGGESDADGWLLRYDSFDPVSEGRREALCTLGNGFFATRGAAPEAGADGIHYPGTYVAGLYNRRVSQVAGQAIENESIVNIPNWLPLTFCIDEGPWFKIGETELLDFSQELNLRDATLTRTVRVKDALGRVTRMDQRRFVNMSDPHTAALETVLCAENWSGTLTVRSGIDGRVTNAGVDRYDKFDRRHLVEVNTYALDDERVGLTARTSQSAVCIAEVARFRAIRDGTPIRPQRRVLDEPGFIAHELSIDLQPLESITFEKVVTLFTSRDRAISDPFTEVSNWSERMKTFDELLDDHVAGVGRAVEALFSGYRSR